MSIPSFLATLFSAGTKQSNENMLVEKTKTSWTRIQKIFLSETEIQLFLTSKILKKKKKINILYKVQVCSISLNAQIASTLHHKRLDIEKVCIKLYMKKMKF